NRLTSAQNAGTDCSVNVLGGKTKYWANYYSYDAWGNLLQKTVAKCNAENLSVTVGGNNQLQGGYGFDSAGNMTWNATEGVSATYDAESRIATAARGGVTTTYTYDDEGNRVKKSTGSTGMLYWYMSLGIVAESDLAGVLQSEYVFFDGERVARKDFPGSAVSYYLSDHLKTASVITDAAGNIKAESDYYPWGGELQFVNNDSNHYKFTGKERDAETGLDYFGARYYSNGLGRWVTPDWSGTPVPVPYADLIDPQTLNQYGYVRNIPTSKADIDGHDWPSWSDVGQFVAGVANAYGSDNLLGAGRVESDNLAYNMGHLVGDAGAVISGVQEVGAGAAGEVGGVALDATGAGAVVGVPVNIVSGVAIAHGATTGVVAGVNLGKDVINAFSGKRQGDFKPSEREQAIKE